MSRLSDLARRTVRRFLPEATIPVGVLFPGASPVFPTDWVAYDQLSACDRSHRVGDRAQTIARTLGMSPWDVADVVRDLDRQDVLMSPQDVADLFHGVRHLRGEQEVDVLARVLDVPVEALTGARLPDSSSSAAATAASSTAVAA
jgi:hypothetical protein